MADLLQTQRLFALALRDATQASVAAGLLALDPDLALRRIALYRGNVAAAGAKALAAAYPVIEKMVGAEFFDGLARRYGKQHPSHSGDLHEHGADFGAFLAGFEPAREFPYLPDLARLEWAVHRAGGAADLAEDATLDRLALAAVPEARQAALRFRLAPGTALTASRFPVARLWTIHQPDYGGEFAVDWTQAETALVARAGLRVTVRTVSAGEAAWLACLLTDTPLEAALEAAVRADPAFDLAAALEHWIGNGLIYAFNLDACRD